MIEFDFLAAFVADAHLDHNPPGARAEEDWYAAMGRTWAQVKTMAAGKPIIVAGDLFNKPDNCAELVNWALDYLPDPLFGVPGNHDLHNHSYRQLHRSSFWTLVRAGKLTPLMPGRPVDMGLFRLHGFPYGFPVKPPGKSCSLSIEVAVIHDLIWRTGFGYHGAPETASVSSWSKCLGGFTTAVFGDNHLGFEATAGDCFVYNCGGLMRRNTDEQLRQPAVGLLLTSGRVSRQYLDCSQDILAGPKPTETKAATDAGPVLSSLKKLTGPAIDFRQAMTRHLVHNKVEEGPKQIILEVMG